MERVRERSWELCRKLDLPVNEHLPALEGRPELRGLDEIVERALVLSVVVAQAHGFKRAKEWLETEQLSGALSPQEHDFIYLGEGDVYSFQWRSEALTSFAFVLSLMDAWPWTQVAPDNLVRQFPDLRVMEPSEKFRRRSRLRANGECVEMLDQAYCLHWACRELDLHGKSHAVDTETLVERRWALEWCLGDEEWDEIGLDT